jgi:hypothetical protein
MALSGIPCNFVSCEEQKNKKLALNLGIQTHQILTNDDEVCIPSLSRIVLAVPEDLDLLHGIE